MALVPSRNDRWGLDAMSSPATLGGNLTRLFDDLTSSLLQSTGSHRFPLDMYETDDRVAIDMAIPGVRAEDLDLQVEGMILYIRGQYAKLSEDKRYWVKTMPHGEFQYTLSLPVKVEADAVEASVKDGILHLELPKVPEARTRKIEIKRLA
ncbi:Hsp20/alpha crystallin family protein [Deinococcus peraridilitoris]|uniref:Molecular chaperone (Small heat shock protein) n=1 Tax=Deinococcus peraridilitoris (strain DSM 19664 / LMG 22246 / CIP 109416 / KR-200) TaxID=937777 RepID=L0A3K3_DEIPD|nr:Hsp20/alpha crystallin family protein [Deinococcus peraridilitoris]AFZ68426.1 molecular chaperone (small heat shock protein) [Deinococcus peraridilitoris DSM 19664]